MPKTKKLVSIVIPFYRNYGQIRQLLSSIEFCPEIEVIVINDATIDSAQDDFALTEEFKSVNIFINPENRGAGYCRNIGLSIAQGDWVIFADSDDYFESNSTKVIVETALSANSEIDICFFPPKAVVYGSSEFSSRADSYLRIFNHQDSNIREVLARVKWHAPWSKMYRRSTLLKNNIKFDEVPAANDVMFSLKAGVFANQIKFVNSCIYTVTESNFSLTKSKSYLNLSSRMSVTLRYNKFLLDLEKKYHYFELPKKLPLILLVRNPISFARGFACKLFGVYARCISVGIINFK